MTREEFFNLLEKHNISKELVLFDDPVKEGFCIRKNYFGWEVFYRERGKEYNCVGFPSESDALQYLFNKLIPYGSDRFETMDSLVVEHSTISDEDVNAFKFPHHIQRIIRIQLVNKGTVIDYTEKRFADQHRRNLLASPPVIKAEEADIIFIEYISKEFPNIVCTLRIENIDSYFCDAYENKIKKLIKKLRSDHRGPLDGLRIRISKRSNSKSPLYFLDLHDFFGILADKIVIENIRYI